MKWLVELIGVRVNHDALLKGEEERLNVLQFNSPIEPEECRLAILLVVFGSSSPQRPLPARKTHELRNEVGAANRRALHRHAESNPPSNLVTPGYSVARKAVGCDSSPRFAGLPDTFIWGQPW